MKGNFPLEFHQIFTYFIGMILVGTSGFQYRDWAPVFYPEHLDPRQWLQYYSRQFHCCELGFTCYRMPEVQAVQEIIEETRENNVFVVRLPDSHKILSLRSMLAQMY